jgi:hypothetical protein
LHCDDFSNNFLAGKFYLPSIDNINIKGINPTATRNKAAL